jgi:tripartite ATP-independent transporter DctM subunit
VLGTIFLGIATPTEGGAMGAVGAVALAAAKGRLNLGVVQQALTSTTRLSSFVMFILLGSRVFSLTFFGVNGHIWVEHLLTSLPGGQYGFLFVVNAIVFFLGFFIDFFEIVFIVIPLILPAAETLGIDFIFLGVILGMNLQTSFLTPPFGFALFYLRSVAPRDTYVDKPTGRRIDGIKTTDIYRGAVNFIMIQVIMILMVVAFPQLVMHYKGPPVNATGVQIQLPGAPGGSGLGGGLPGLGGGLPGLGAPPPGLGAPPNLGAPPALGGPPPVTPPAPSN